MIFARKMPEFYIKIARKFFSRILGVTCPPPVPVSYAYGYVCQNDMQYFDTADTIRYNTFKTRLHGVAMVT